MQKSIIYDLETILLRPPKDKPKDPTLKYCGGWTDYLNMGISIITVYISSGFNSFPEGIKTFINKDDSIPYNFPEFQNLLAEKPIILGFNSQRFDDKVAQANNIDITTNYDIYAEIRKAVGGTGTYALQNLAAANGLSKGDGFVTPLWWQVGRQDEVVAYGRQEMETLVEILGLGLRGRLKNPNNGHLINLPPTNLDMTYYRQLST